MFYKCELVVSAAAGRSLDKHVAKKDLTPKSEFCWHMEIHGDGIRSEILMRMNI